MIALLAALLIGAHGGNAACGWWAGIQYPTRFWPSYVVWEPNYGQALKEARVLQARIAPGPLPDLSPRVVVMPAPCRSGD